MKNQRFLSLAILILASCTAPRTMRITYYSHPPGAVLYMNNECFGYCPVSFQHNIDRNDYKRGNMTLQSPTVLWVSGATANVECIITEFTGGSYNYVYTFYRSFDIPNYEMDAQFGIQHERNRIYEAQAYAQQAQADAQQAQASATMLNAIQNAFKNTPSIRTRSGTINTPGSSPIYYNETQYGP